MKENKFDIINVILFIISKENLYAKDPQDLDSHSLKIKKT